MPTRSSACSLYAYPVGIMGGSRSERSSAEPGTVSSPARLRHGGEMGDQIAERSAAAFVTDLLGGAGEDVGAAADIGPDRGGDLRCRAARRRSSPGRRAGEWRRRRRSSRRCRLLVGLILDLAVRGRLVKQRESEGMASELVEKLEAERQRRSPSKRSRREIDPLMNNEAPFTGGSSPAACTTARPRLTARTSESRNPQADPRRSSPRQPRSITGISTVRCQVAIYPSTRQRRADNPGQRDAVAAKRQDESPPRSRHRSGSPHRAEGSGRSPRRCRSTARATRTAPMHCQR